jgi:uncharacterized membrane-anchored protein
MLHSHSRTFDQAPSLCNQRQRKEKCVKKSLVAISDVISAYLPTGSQMLSKVPEVTIFFWIIKILATTVGETGADYLTYHLKWGLLNTTYVMTAILIATLFFQFKLRAYVAPVYWITVVLISIVGTLITDSLVDQFGVALEITTTIFTVTLPVIFAAWYASEKTLSIHSIFTTKREAFYWLAILFTFAFGTAAGDLVAENLKVGYLNSAFVFVALIGVIAVGHYRFKLNAVLSFWLVYILTRPLGASLGDYVSQTQSRGGLDFGTKKTSAVFLVLILGLVVYLTKTRKDALPHPISAEAERKVAVIGNL